MTQKNAIAYVLANCELPTEVEEKLVALHTSLEKKSAKSGERKPTKTQIANEGFKEIILANMEHGRLYTVTELAKEIPFGEELSNQRVSALVRQLKESGKVVRTEEKRKAYFSLAWARWKEGACSLFFNAPIHRVSLIGDLARAKKSLFEKFKKKCYNKL